jgi:hypothetical protein
MSEEPTHISGDEAPVEPSVTERVREILHDPEGSKKVTTDDQYRKEGWQLLLGCAAGPIFFFILYLLLRHKW